MNIFQQAIRNLQRKKGLTSLRILSLFIGGVIALYIFQYNAQQESYDDFWKNGDRLFRLTLQELRNGEEVSNSARCFGGAPMLFRNEIPEIENTTFFEKDIITVFSQERQFNHVNWLWSDTAIFNVLERKILLAESSDIWHDVHGVAISQSFANKLFGHENPINQRFKLNEGWEFHVTAVFEDIPNNSHLSVDVVGSFNSLMYYMRNFDNEKSTLVDNPAFNYNPNIYGGWFWRQPSNMRNYCYVKLKPNTTIASIQSQIPAAMQKVNLSDKLDESELKFGFQPVKNIHLHSNLNNEIGVNGDKNKVQFLYIIAFVVLIVSAVNFINLSSMQTIEYGKQFAIKLLNGAKINSIISYLSFENMLIVLVSFACSLICISLLAAKLGLWASFSSKGILMVLSLLLIAGILASTYAYFTGLHGKFNQYLKTQTGSLSGNWQGRKFIVILQFSISIILISGTILINKQLSFMMDYDLGFEPEQTMFSYSPMSMNQRADIPAKLAVFRDRVITIPGVKNFCISSSIPGKEIHTGSNEIKLAEGEEPVPHHFSFLSISESYTDLFNLELLAGENLTLQNDWISNEVLINQLAADRLGFKNPKDAIGSLIKYRNTEKKIVGVIKNYHHESLKKQLQPTIMEQNLRWDHAVGYYSIRFSSNTAQTTLHEIEKIWEEIYPLETADFNFIDQQFEAQYASEKQFKMIISIGSIIAILISCMGLFACALFDTQKRIREIGIRKVNGATVLQIISLLNKDLLKWIVLALMASVPISWYTLSIWLSDYAYKTSISWWIFALAGFLTILVALITVSWQSLKAATQNPVKSLRYE